MIVVDSTSHIWSGDGGVLDWQEEELDRMAGDNWQKREQCKMAAWIKPKLAHKHFVQKLLQVRAHIILCFRGEPKIEMVREDGKTKIVAKQSLTGLDGWIPICEKNLPFELTASFLMMADSPGIPKPIKLQEQHRKFIRLDAPLDEDAGRRLSDWSKGGTTTQPDKKNADKVDSVGSEQAITDFLSMISGASDIPELKEFFTSAMAWAKNNGRDVPSFTIAKDKRKAELE